MHNSAEVLESRYLNHWCAPEKTCGAFMTAREKRDFERHIDEFYGLCEKILMRTLIFGCFVYELDRFAVWLLR